VPLILEHTIDLGQRWVIQSLQELSLKEKVLMFSPIGTNQLFEGKPILLDTLIPHQIDRTEPALAKHVFYQVLTLYDCPNREKSLFLHATPQGNGSVSRLPANYEQAAVLTEQIGTYFALILPPKTTMIKLS